MSALDLWLAQNVMLVLLAFARIGTAMMLMPGFGESAIPARAKVALGMLVSLSLFAMLPLPAVPSSPALLGGLVVFEVLIGAFIGLGARIFMAVFHILGGIIGYAAGLSNALAPQDANFEGASAVAGLLHMSALALIFATDMHHLMLSGIVRSYQVMPVGALMMGDMVEQLARLGGSAFYIAMMVGAPFLVFTVLFNLALGLANRVMPTMQVFFVAGPGLILMGLGLLAIAAPAMLQFVQGEFSAWLMDLRR